MKKNAAFLIIAMIFSISIAITFNILSAEELPSGGTFTENIELAISQNLPLRNSFSDLMDTILYASGVRKFDNIYIGSNGSLLRDIEAPNQRTFSAAKSYILGYSEKNQIKPYFMLVPTSSAILVHEMDNFAAKDIYNQRNMILKMYSAFDGLVRTADIYQTLYDHRTEYIYYHTEDMPTSLGGYYIYGELCSRLGIKQNEMDSFSAAYVAHGFYGSLATDFLRVHSKPDFVTLYEHVGSTKTVMVEHYNENSPSKVTSGLFIYSEDSFSDKTDMILGGTSAKMEIYFSESHSEETSILIFGDESAKSWLPFLISNYGRITFIDLNLISEKTLSSIKTSEYDQVLFAYSTATFSSGISFEKLEYLG